MKLLKNKKFIIPLAIILVLIGGIGAVILNRRDQGESTPTQEQERRRITDPVNVIPIAQRPYVAITPRADGRHLDINIIHLNKPATEVDYELEYQSGSMLQGAMGLIQLNSLPVSEEIFLGSCSAGGACTYHENITGGNLLLRFSGGQESYAVKTDWRYFDNASRENAVASRDAKFQLEADVLASHRFLVVFNSYGIPEGLQEDVIADHFALRSSGNLQASQALGSLLIRTNEESPTATIVGYDGSQWHEFETTVEGREVSAQVQLMELYTAIR